jgi:hypothetical protein
MKREQQITEKEPPDDKKEQKITKKEPPNNEKRARDY